MRKQGSIINGFVLILVGLFFLAAQFVPGLASLINFGQLWPLIVLGLGVIFLVSAVLGRTPGLAIPGTILTGIGSNLLYFNSTDNWHHWPLWLLVPCYVGVGLILNSTMNGRSWRHAMPAAGILMFIGSGLFFIFLAADLWPIALIVVGTALLLRNLRRRTKHAVSHKL
ncbi:MAG: hypothetical protein IPL28_24585 [Chloroflexi bacterium]|nr:hypothetical protein [Chloroflexota bacterium]